MKTDYSQYYCLIRKLKKCKQPVALVPVVDIRVTLAVEDGSHVVTVGTVRTVVEQIST